MLETKYLLNVENTEWRYQDFFRYQISPNQILRNRNPPKICKSLETETETSQYPW